MGSACPLTGRVILLVEDDPLIALDLVDLCKSAGAQAISARSLGEAAATIGFATIPAAVLDYRLGGNEVGSLCESLRARKNPFFFYSGYSDLQARFPDCVVVQKRRPVKCCLIRSYLWVPQLLQRCWIRFPRETAPRTATHPFS